MGIEIVVDHTAIRNSNAGGMAVNYEIGFVQTLFLEQLHDFSLLSLNSFLDPFFKSKFMKNNSLTPK